LKLIMKDEDGTHVRNVVTTRGEITVLDHADTFRSMLDTEDFENEARKPKVLRLAKETRKHNKFLA